MDSSKDSERMKNTVKFEGDGGTDKNYAGVQTQGRPRENAENLFTITSQSSSFVPSNGPQEHMHPTFNQQCQQPNKDGDNRLEGNASSNCTPSQMCNKVMNNDGDQKDSATAGGSGSTPKTQDNGMDTNQEKSCQRNTGSNNLPSTSGASRAAENPEVGGLKESRKRPSSLKLSRPSLDEGSSSDTGAEDYSLGSEDGCIYTYRGGEHLADLPSSFFSLDMGLPLDRHLPLRTYPVPQRDAGRNQGSRASSPDMEFLEMDFDPGPSCEVDTGDELSPDMEVEVPVNMPEQDEPVPRPPTPEQLPPIPPRPPVQNPVNATASTSSGSYIDIEAYTYSAPSSSHGVMMGQGDAWESHRTCNYGPYITHVNTKGEHLLVKRTMACRPISSHVSTADWYLPGESDDEEDSDRSEGEVSYRVHQGERRTSDSVNLFSELYHSNMIKKLMADKRRADSEAQSAVKLCLAGSSTAPVSSGTIPTGGAAAPADSGAAGSAATASAASSTAFVEPPRSMIWSENEACERQVTQIAISASGATAVVNVFNALGVPVNLEKIHSAIATRMRSHNAPLPRYLLSRAIAGCTVDELVAGIHKASDGLVTARFFPTYPERAISLSHWLADWITLGAVPILTLNLQVGCDGDIPDFWQHQMVFGVSPRGIYVTNPVECVRESALWPQLSSPSVLLVRTKNILARFAANTDLTPLMAVPDKRFQTFNVLGQVANVVREARALGWGGRGAAGGRGTRTRHVRIPAAWRAGVTVAALTGSEAHRRLVSAAELPLLAYTDAE